MSMCDVRVCSKGLFAQNNLHAKFKSKRGLVLMDLQKQKNVC